MVTDLIATSADTDEIRMSARVWDAMMALRSYLFENVYFSERAKAEEPKANQVVRMLFTYYLEHLDELPEEFRPAEEDEPVQRVVDYVSGMTDRFAIREFERLFIPKKWLV
jgi:dGTPase